MRIHIVQKGDSLWRIAEQYGVDFEQLKAANNHLANENELMPGMKVYIPVMEGRQESPYLFPRRPDTEGSLRKYDEQNDGVQMRDNSRLENEQYQNNGQVPKQDVRPERNEERQSEVPRYPQNNRHQYVCSYCMQPLGRSQPPFHPYYERNMNYYGR